MTTKVLKDIYSDAIAVSSSGDTWVLAQGAMIVSSGEGFRQESGASGNTYEIAGLIRAPVAVGVTSIAGGTTTVNLAATGRLIQGGILADLGGTLTANIDGRISSIATAIDSSAAKTVVDVGKHGSISTTSGDGIDAAGILRADVTIAGRVSGADAGFVSAALKTTLNVLAGGVLEGGSVAASMTGTGQLDATIDGELRSAVNYGLAATLVGDISVKIGTEGLVDSSVGLLLASVDHTSFSNQGDVFSLTGGVFVGGTTMDAYNNGLIEGEIGMSVGGDGHVVNDVNGKISAATTALGVGAFDYLHVFAITNHGLIEAAGVAIDATLAGDVSIASDGSIIGKVELGDGDDVVDLRGGSLKGMLSGGNGNDTLITDNARIKLVETSDGGTKDTVKSTVSYVLNDNVERLYLLGSAKANGTGNASDNILRGNSGNNVLNGLAGLDDLDGGKGNDKLTGGGDADTFHFSTGGGKDTITDFTHLTDKIDLSHWDAIGTFSQLKNHAADDGHGNLAITAGTDTLTILGMAKADLASGDFTF